MWGSEEKSVHDPRAFCAVCRSTMEWCLGSRALMCGNRWTSLRSPMSAGSGSTSSTCSSAGRLRLIAPWAPSSCTCRMRRISGGTGSSSASRGPGTNHPWRTDALPAVSATAACAPDWLRSPKAECHVTEPRALGPQMSCWETCNGWLRLPTCDTVVAERLHVDVCTLPHGSVTQSWLSVVHCGIKAFHWQYRIQIEMPQRGSQI